ncbi:thioredoxin domain-containing protein [Microbacterium sp. STN6]|uniref:DsbA family protein n=1 Tax=Microbacterium sp. STN6 TaxID=2995588 RepID=UPI002260B8F6|nr:thioredoxin domain-containing protein [Microbacterium sp. STN6]MCX7523394.1 thioredoxin domain-containing protein [Microbacterium sp. STN6]
MTNASPSDDRENQNRGREAARVKARTLREKQKKKEKRGRAILQGGIAVAVVAALAIIAIIIVGSVRPPVSGPKNMASDGIVIGSGLKAKKTQALPPTAEPVASTPDATGSVVTIRLYVDYFCRTCGQFARANGKEIGELAKSGAVTVEVHPIALLSSLSSGTRYSLRAANAAACVADKAPNSFYRFHLLLFEHQPKESSSGLTDDQLKSYVTKSGASHRHSIERCIDDGRFKTWVQAATDRAVAGPIPNSDLKPSKLDATPLVIVNGKHYKGSLTSARDFKSFVLQASGETYQASTASPVPTPTATAEPQD